MEAHDIQPRSPLDSSGQDHSGLDWRDGNRRRSWNRRHRSTRFWDSLLGRWQRRDGRRTKDRQNLYVDVYRRSDVLLLAGIFLLNIFDAFFTLRWLEMGGQEGNPLMAKLLEEGDLVFLIQKCFVVGVWLVILIVHKNFRVARIGLWSLLVIYGLLLLYHVYHVAAETSPILPPVG